MPIYCILLPLKNKDVNFISVACQTNLSPSGHPALLDMNDFTIKTALLSDSIEPSVVSNDDDEDIITIMTNDRVSASVLHADSDTLNVDEDKDKVVSPLHSPSRTGETKPALKSHISQIKSSEQTTNDGSKKSVRFQDLEHNLNFKETVVPGTLDKVGRNINNNAIPISTGSSD